MNSCNASVPFIVRFLRLFLLPVIATLTRMASIAKTQCPPGDFTQNLNAAVAALMANKQKPQSMLEVQQSCNTASILRLRTCVWCLHDVC